jgi:antitoxin component YwqK of YwqJK toxin-antitoxin module
MVKKEFTPISNWKETIRTIRGQKRNVKVRRVRYSNGKTGEQMKIVKKKKVEKKKSSKHKSKVKKEVYHPYSQDGRYGEGHYRGFVFHPDITEDGEIEGYMIYKNNKRQSQKKFRNPKYAADWVDKYLDK